MSGAGYSLEQLEIRAAFLAVSYNYAPKKIALVAAGLEGELNVMREKVDALAAENARLRALVEHVEWVYTGETTWVCPWCNGEKYAGGHAADCPRQAALGEGE